MTRHSLSWAVPTLAFVLTAILVYVFRNVNENTWPELAAEGCRARVFTIPNNLLPPDLRVLLGPEAAQRESELRNALPVTINELADRELPAVRVNLNCRSSDYDPNALNVYIVGNDTRGQFKWAEGMILTRSDGHDVLVIGKDFWDFFARAWRPILDWRMQTTNTDFLQALGDHDFELYQFYLEWAIAHELGHMRLGHYPQTAWFDNEKQRRLELEADIEAARTIRGNYMQITPQLLEVVNESMKYEFTQTYHRAWSGSDGEPFQMVGAGFVTSSWTIDLNYCDSTHPPFLLRSLSMIEAAAKVGNEQAQQIAVQERNAKREALLQEGSIESELALEQMPAEEPQDTQSSSQWSTALLELVPQLRNRIILHRRLFSLACS